jgi:hypothetical protein
MNITAEFPGSKNSPTIRTVVCLPPEESVYSSPTAVPVAVMKWVLTSASPRPEYQRPATTPYPVQLASPLNETTDSGSASPGTLIRSSVSGM